MGMKHRESLRNGYHTWKACRWLLVDRLGRPHNCFILISGIHLSFSFFFGWIFIQSFFFVVVFSLNFFMLHMEELCTKMFSKSCNDVRVLIQYLLRCMCLFVCKHLGIFLKLRCKKWRDHLTPSLEKVCSYSYIFAPQEKAYS